MLDSLTIRAARPDESQLLTDLAVRSKAYWGYSRDFIEACRAELTVAPGRLRSGPPSCFVAHVSNAIYGFYAIDAIADDGYELDALFVEPDFIGRGVGRALIVHACETVAQSGGRSLIVQSDPYAESFYVNVGGRRVGSRESDSVPGRYLPVFEIPIDPISGRATGSRQ